MNPRLGGLVALALLLSGPTPAHAHTRGRWDVWGILGGISHHIDPSVPRRLLNQDQHTLGLSMDHGPWDVLLSRPCSHPAAFEANTLPDRRNGRSARRERWNRACATGARTPVIASPSLAGRLAAIEPKIPPGGSAQVRFLGLCALLLAVSNESIDARDLDMPALDRELTWLEKHLAFIKPT
ncbi:MAG: hypothetical protein ACYCS1_07915 [Gammaproteobacteria bacterium]